MNIEEGRKKVAGTRVFVAGLSDEVQGVQKVLFKLGAKWKGYTENPCQHLYDIHDPFIYISDELILSTGRSLMDFRQNSKKEILVNDILALDSLINWDDENASRKKVADVIYGAVVSTWPEERIRTNDDEYYGIRIYYKERHCARESVTVRICADNLEAAQAQQKCVVRLMTNLPAAILNNGLRVFVVAKIIGENDLIIIRNEKP